MNKSKKHNITPKNLNKEDEDVPLTTLLENLNNNYFNFPLPCREKEIQIITKFIEQTYNPDCPEYDPHKRGRKPRGLNEIPPPSLLYITGNPGTGKTECVRYCCQHSRVPSSIRYINCKTQKVDLYKENDIIPRVLVLDEVESYPDFAEIASNSLQRRYSLICISNAHENKVIIQKASGMQVDQLSFPSYTLDDLVQILTARMGGNCKNINDAALKYLCNNILKDRGDARAAITKLNIVLGAAIQEELTTISFNDMIRLVNLQKVPIKYELPLYTQIALIAIFRSGKNWVKTFHQIISQKGYEPYNDVKAVFDQLLSYPDLVKGNVKNPIAVITKEGLMSTIDEQLQYAI